MNRTGLGVVLAPTGKERHVLWRLQSVGHNAVPEKRTMREGDDSAALYVCSKSVLKASQTGPLLCILERHVDLDVDVKVLIVLRLQTPASAKS